MSDIPNAIQQAMQPPDRIYNWLDTQLSIARHYGCIRVQGRMYVIDTEDQRQPLVRTDVLDTERLQRIRAERAKRAAETLKTTIAQGTIL